MPDKVRHFLADLLNWLNGVGATLLAYALMNPTVGSDLLNLLPAAYRTPTALLVPALWFGLVQYAKVRAIKKAS